MLDCLQYSFKVVLMANRLSDYSYSPPSTLLYYEHYVGSPSYQSHSAMSRSSLFQYV